MEEETIKEEQPDRIALAKMAADELKAENDRKEKLLEREERLQAERIVSGHSQAGQVPEQPKEETPQEYAQRLARGELKDGEGKLTN